MLASKNIRWFKVFESMEEARIRVPLNKTVRVDLNGQALCLVHTPDGFFALDDKCPHQGMPISKGGICEDGHIVCPFHRYSWDLKTKKESRGVEANIRLYPLAEKQDGLFIGIESRKSWWKMF